MLCMRIDLRLWIALLILSILLYVQYSLWVCMVAYQDSTEPRLAPFVSPVGVTTQFQWDSKDQARASQDLGIEIPSSALLEKARRYANT